MAQCQICEIHEAEFAWQPFGPEPNCRDDGAFSALYHQKKGWAVRHICWDCKGEIQNGERISFDYQNETFYLVGELPPMNSHEYHQGSWD